jgi:hypothetical protein
VTAAPSASDRVGVGGRWRSEGAASGRSTARPGGVEGRRAAEVGGGRRRRRRLDALRRDPETRGAARRGRASGTDALAPRHESTTTAVCWRHAKRACDARPATAAAEKHRHARDMPAWHPAGSEGPAGARSARRRSARPLHSHLPSREAHRAQESNVRVRWACGDGPRSWTRRGYGAWAAGEKRAK